MKKTKTRPKTKTKKSYKKNKTRKHGYVSRGTHKNKQTIGGMKRFLDYVMGRPPNHVLFQIPPVASSSAMPPPPGSVASSSALPPPPGTVASSSSALPPHPPGSVASSSSVLPPPPPSTKNENKRKVEEISAPVCAICLEEIMDNQPVTKCSNRREDYKHEFHSVCIARWCGDNENNCVCPICKVNGFRIDPEIQCQVLYFSDRTLKENERRVDGKGSPTGLKFILLAPQNRNQNSALSNSNRRRWPKNYRPTETELNEWRIVMNHAWWNLDAGKNLPLGWYLPNQEPEIYLDSVGVPVIDPYYIPPSANNNGTVLQYDDDKYINERDRLTWMLPDPTDYYYYSNSDIDSD